MKLPWELGTGMANTLVEIVEKNEPATKLGKIDGWQMLWPILFVLQQMSLHQSKKI